MNQFTNTQYFLQGGGQIGQVIRSKNWNTTPFNNPDYWPQSLRSTIATVINNPVAMAIVWSKNYNQIFNDAFDSILRNSNRNSEIGSAFQQTFPDIFHLIEQKFENVMQGEIDQLTTVLLSKPNTEVSKNLYFDFSFSPIWIENGEVGGILITLIESKGKSDELSNTDRILQKQTEDALIESRDALEFALEAAQLGTFDYNPFTNKFSANRRLKNWFGLSAEQEIDLSHALSSIVESDKSTVINAIQTAIQFSSGGQYDIEYSITNPISQQEICLHAKGKAWFNNDKIAYRFNGTVEDVTAKTNARRLTALNEAINKNIVLEAPIGICLIDAATLITENVNDRFVEIVGKERDEIDQKPYWETFAEAKDIYEKDLEHVIATGLPFSITGVEVFLLRNGISKPVFITFYYSPLKNEDGEVVKIAVWVIDHTAEIAAQHKIAESDANLKLMISQAPIAISILRGSDYVVEIVNNNTLALWGRTEEEVLNKSVFDSMPELQNQGIKKILDDVVSNGLRYSANELEIVLLRKAIEETIYVNFSYEPLYDAHNTITGIMCIGFEVTEQVYVRKKAIENEQSIRSLVESAPFPIAVYKGKEMEITLANQSIIDAWGKGNDVIGKTYTEILPELRDQEIFKQIESVFTTGIPFHKTNQRIDLEKDNKLSTYYFNYSFTPLFDLTGSIYGVMNTAADVTALHKAQQKVEDSEKRFRNSVFQAPLGIAIFRGPEFVTEIANANYLNLVDKTETELIGLPLFEALPEVKEVVLPIFEDILKTGQPFYANELSVQLKIADKVELHYFNLVYHPLFEETSEVSGIMVVATEVTNTVKAKHLLQQSESHFRHMVMQSPTPMTILRGSDFVIESANAAMLNDIWQRQQSEVVGKPIGEAFPELKDQKYFQLLEDVFHNGKTHSEKESFATVKNNDSVREFYFDFEYAPLSESDGEINAIMITANDVTDKVTARKKVEIAEERLRLATEATGIATWDLDLINQTVIHSPRLAEIFGFEKSTMIGVEQYGSMFHRDDANIVAKAKELANVEGVYNYEARVIKVDGSITWIRTQGKVYFDEKGQAFKIIGTTRDINDEKTLQQVLIESEAKFRLLADSIPQHIWTADTHGNIFYFNQFVFSYSGLSLRELQTKGWMQIVHPDDREENTKLWLESIATGTDFLLEHRFRRKDGSYRWQLSRAVPQRDENGKIRMWVGTSTDVQDQKMFTEELEKLVTERTSEINQKNNALETMNKDLQSFAYISSHDLQEPLRKIQIFASQIIAKEAENLSKSGLEKFDRIQIAANRMQTLIQDLLVYSRSSFQERILERTTLDAVIDEVTEDLSEELIEKNATITVLHSCELHIITLQFRQLIFNLISNSLKFARENTAPVIIINSEIALGATFENKKLVPDQLYCHISVKDNGVGFSQKYHEKIFEVFQRLHAREQFAGTGIGLAIVKKIVDNHNGFISAKSALGEGAVFDVYVPG